MTLPNYRSELKFFMEVQEEGTEVEEEFVIKDWVI